MDRPIFILTFSIWRLDSALMSSLELTPSTLAKIEGIRTPTDFFSETRISLNLFPEKILCFTRKSRAEALSKAADRHQHHRYVMVVPLQASGIIFVDDRRFSVNYPQVLLIFPFQFHHGFYLDQPRGMWLIVTFEIKDGRALEALRLHPLRKMKNGDYSPISGLVDAWSSKSRTDELSHWLGLFLTRLLSAPPASLVRENLSKSQKRASSLLLKINQHCMPNLHQPLGLKDLAARMAISESNLRARFRKETGMSLGHHLRRLRLQKAMSLLLQSELSVSQIAERCGFDSIFSFSRSFRRFTGVSATDYRHRLV